MKRVRLVLDMEHGATDAFSLCTISFQVYISSLDLLATDTLSSSLVMSAQLHALSHLFYSSPSNDGMVGLILVGGNRNTARVDGLRSLVRELDIYVRAKV